MVTFAEKLKQMVNDDILRGRECIDPGFGAIRNRYKEGVSAKNLSKEYEVHTMHIYNICNGRRRQSVK